MKTTMFEMKSTLNCMNSRLVIAEENTQWTQRHGNRNYQNETMRKRIKKQRFTELILKFIWKYKELEYPK